MINPNWADIIYLHANGYKPEKCAVEYSTKSVDGYVSIYTSWDKLQLNNLVLALSENYLLILFYFYVLNNFHNIL